VASYDSAVPRHLTSLPTRRSSDLSGLRSRSETNANWPAPPPTAVATPTAATASQFGGGVSVRASVGVGGTGVSLGGSGGSVGCRSEEHTSALQSRENLVCRLLPER